MKAKLFQTDGQMEVYEQIIDKKETVIQGLTEQLSKLEEQFESELKQSKLEAQILMGESTDRASRHEQ